MSAKGQNSIRKPGSSLSTVTGYVLMSGIRFAEGQVFTVVCRPALGTIQHPKQRSRSSRGVELRVPMLSSAQWAPGNLLRVDKAAEV